MKLWHHILSWLIIGGAMAVSSLFIFWSLEPLTPVVSLPRGLVVENTEVDAGGFITIHAPYCKNQETQGVSITRSFQDQIVYYLPTTNTNVPKGCVDYTTQVQVPSNLPSDTYTYTIKMDFRLNPIKVKSYSFTTNEFKVVRKEIKL